MTNKEKIQKLKELLNLSKEEEKVELAEMTLKNGTVIEAESFEAGEAVFIKSEDNKEALPVGEYELEDNKILVVSEEGVIAEIKDKPEESTEEVEAEGEVVTRAEFDELKSVVMQLIEMVEAMSSEEEVEASEDKSEESKEDNTELSEEDKEKVEASEDSKEESDEKEKVEASEDEPKPFKHNPEKDTKKKVNLSDVKNNKDTLSRVFTLMSRS